MSTAEHVRLDEARHRASHWKRWGPYVSERAWGTVREDYSPGGTAWSYFPFEAARSRAYRWNEDGIAGICDRHQVVCLALAFWNERDAILKERMFGLTGEQGNHGEDVKEYYFYLDSTPTHSYMRFLYKYPQGAFPYAQLVDENARRGREAPEYELLDTGIFEGNRYFDITVEYAKADPEDVLMRIRVENRGPDDAPLHVLPTIWFRNTWSWAGLGDKPSLVAMGAAPPGTSVIQVESTEYGARWLYADDAPPLLFTENETNGERLFGMPGGGFYTDGIGDAVVEGRTSAVNPEQQGTKAAAHYTLHVPAGGHVDLRLRFSDKSKDGIGEAGPFGNFDALMSLRLQEADDYYAAVSPRNLSVDAKTVMRQAFAGLLWSKQYYHYIVRDWLEGDPAQPPPPPERKRGRNHDWPQLYNADVISMPDKWEYPWYAAWDLAFHCVPLALVDSDFAKDQLLLFCANGICIPMDSCRPTSGPLAT